MHLNVFVVEDNAEIREGLAGALEELTCVRVVGASATEDEAADWLARSARGWDMTIIDLFLHKGSGIRLLQRVRRALPHQKLIVFSNYVNSGVRKRCAQLGADAVFDKSTEIDALVDYCSHQCSLVHASAVPATAYASGESP